MGLFEVLIILVFIVIPILEGVLKKRREKTAPPPPPPAPRRQPVGAGASREGGGGVATSEPGPAADMIPPDLWEVLTGERRPPRSEREPVDGTWEPAPWEGEAEIASEGIPLGTAADETIEDSAPWDSEGWDIGRSEDEIAEPVSLEYVGPEAISLEQPLPPPEVRHRLFHEKYDAPVSPVAGRVRVSGRDVRAGLQGHGLRRSILLAEILGPPKGLV